MSRRVDSDTFSHFVIAPMIPTLALLLVACAGKDTPAAEKKTAARDSAGVQIVTNPDPDSAAPRWRLSDTTKYELHSAEDSSGPIFVEVVAPLRLSDESVIFVAEGAPVTERSGDNMISIIPAKLLVFDRYARFLRKVGRQGRGPGEFTRVDALIPLPADTVIVFDRATGMSVMTAKGDFIRRFSPPQSPLGTVEMTPMRFADGTLVASVTHPRSIPGGIALENEYLRVDALGKLLNRIAGPLSYVTEMAEMNLWAPHGSTTVAGDMLYHAAGKAYEIDGYSKDGKLVRIIRLDRTPRTMTDADAAHFREVRTAMAVANGDPKPDFKRWKFGGPLPAITQLRTDRMGNIWALEGSVLQGIGDDRANWLVFDSTGKYVAHVSTPPRMEVSDIGADYMLGVCRGHQGNAIVCLYGLTR